MLLPCTHDPSASEQVNPAIDLLRHLDNVHPDVLRAHGLQPEDYHPKLVFRSAVESIRGSYIASSITQRQKLVADALEVMKQDGLIAQYQFKGTLQRFDFEVMVAPQPRDVVAVEVKGGEGNSINISERPLWATEFILWCHLDGAIVNEPSHGAAAIIFSRVANEMVKRGRQVDAVIFKDARCNAPLRPCPKYQNRTVPSPLGVAPDIFLMPQTTPTQENPKPSPHNLSTTRLPARILRAHGVAPHEFDSHVWQVAIELSEDKGRLLRETRVFHKWNLVESRTSRR